MTTNSDKIKINDSLSSLEISASAEPYRFGLPGSKVITFPDPGEMPWDQAEEFLAGLSAPDAKISEIMEKWLSDEDYQTLKDAKLSLRQMIALAQKVTKHYEAVLGAPGEE